jgi:hypothetical protein
MFEIFCMKLIVHLLDLPRIVSNSLNYTSFGDINASLKVKTIKLSILSKSTSILLTAQKILTTGTAHILEIDHYSTKPSNPYTRLIYRICSHSSCNQEIFKDVINIHKLCIAFFKLLYLIQEVKIQFLADGRRWVHLQIKLEKTSSNTTLELSEFASGVKSSWIVPLNWQ